jgi:hypothetical protein
MGLLGKKTKGDLIFQHSFSEGNNRAGVDYRNLSPVFRLESGSLREFQSNWYSTEDGLMVFGKKPMAFR